MSKRNVETCKRILAKWNYHGTNAQFCAEDLAKLLDSRDEKLAKLRSDASWDAENRLQVENSRIREMGE